MAAVNYSGRMGRLTGTLLLLLLLTGALFSGVLLLKHHGEPLGGAADALCDAAGNGGCDTVARSEYAELGGVPLAALGLGVYLSLALLVVLAELAGAEARSAAGGVVLVTLGVALIVDLMLLGVQAFAIHAYCALCLATYVVNLAAFLVLFGARRSLGGIARALLRGDGRIAFAGWLAGSLALVAAVGLADVALIARAQGRQATILGAAAPRASAPAATPESSATQPDVGPTPESDAGTPATPLSLAPEARQEQADAASLRRELEQARAEARRLQGILDDPRQLAAYENEKAQKEWQSAERQTVDLASTPGKGPDSAPIVVVEYSDFLCPYCRNLADGLAQFLPQSQGRIRLYFKNYPLDKECSPELRSTVHAGACRVALGAVCASEQGKFWEYHDKVFSAPPQNPTVDDVVRIAAQAGLDSTRLRECVGEPATRVRLAEDIAEGRRVGVSGTPTLLVNGKRLPRIGDFLQAVEDESHRLGLPSLLPQGGQ